MCAVYWDACVVDHIVCCAVSALQGVCGLARCAFCFRLSLCVLRCFVGSVLEAVSRALCCVLCVLPLGGMCVLLCASMRAVCCGVACAVLCPIVLWCVLRFCVSHALHVLFWLVCDALNGVLRCGLCCVLNCCIVPCAVCYYWCCVLHHVLCCALSAACCDVCVVLCARCDVLCWVCLL